MRTRAKLLFGALTAIVVLGALVGTASANRFGLSNQTFRAVWSGAGHNLVFGSIIECPVTLEGSFHSATLSKVAGQLVGYVTKAFVAEGSCNNGARARALTETLPWHILYESFTEALPNITGINVMLVGAAFLITTALTGSCLYITEENNPALGIIGRNATTKVATELTAGGSIPKHSGGGFCPNPGGFEGATSSLKVLGSTTTNITVELVQ